jgi:hypothetical protein
VRNRRRPAHERFGVLPGNKLSRITTCYSAVELSRLVEAAEKVADQDGRKPQQLIMRGALNQDSRKRWKR